MTYPQFYEEEARQQPGEKRTLRLVATYVPDFPYFACVSLRYQWDAALPEGEAERLKNRGVAYVACAIYDAALAAGLRCRESEIPNGRRPAWLIEGARAPVSVALSDIDVEEQACEMTITEVVTWPHARRDHEPLWARLQAAFEAAFGAIEV